MVIPQSISNFSMRGISNTLTPKKSPSLYRLRIRANKEIKMRITKPGKYKLTKDYDQADGHWAIRVIPAGTIIEVIDVPAAPQDSTDYQVLSNALGWTWSDLPVEPIE
jgi:hypothetical protein